MTDMTTNEEPSASEAFPKIILREDDIPKSRLQLFVTIIVSVFIVVLVTIDQLLELWSFGIYWILFSLGLIGSTITIWVLLRWDKGHRQEGAKTFLEKWGEEIGWPLMILAFTIQFVIPQIRPVLLGGVLGGSWFLVIRKGMG
jgi:hypothetical protein